MKHATIFLLMAATLAGCAEPISDSPPAAIVNPDDVVLNAGAGAIQGLLLDDRLRPVAGGFILLQPLAMTATSNDDGVFQFLNIAPGAYTLRTTVEGHEATPHRVQVADGEFAEAQIVARRAASEGGTVLTQEFSVFIPCFVDHVVNNYVANCLVDLSGDSYRASFESNYTATANVTYLVTEMKASQPGRYAVQVRETGNGDRYAVGEIVDGDYIKMVNQVGVVNEEHNGQGINVAWNNTESNPFDTILFPRGDHEGIVPDNPAANPCCGVGAGFGIRATFIQSVFIGEPQVDLASYCSLCD